MEDQTRRNRVSKFPLISALDNYHFDIAGQSAKVDVNATWHIDHMNQELPPKSVMLYAVGVPDKSGATSDCNAPRQPRQRRSRDTLLAAASHQSGRAR